MHRASSSRRVRLSLDYRLLLCFLLLGLPTSRASGDSLDLRHQRALEFEKRGAWLEACRTWDDFLRKDRHNPLAREGYQRCWRRLQLTLRHSDPEYLQSLQRLTPAQALEVYEQTLTILNVGYPDRGRVGFARMFRQGLEELRLALSDPLFRKQHLSGAKSSALAAFQARLASWPDRPIPSRLEAREKALEVVRAASRDGLSLRPATTSAMILEFAAGACNTLDEHSSFLSPGNLALMQDTLRGKLVGVGVEVGLDEDDQARVLRVHHKSPAEDAGLMLGDRLVRIAGLSLEHLPIDAITERLLGDPGSLVELELERPGEEGTRTVRMIRRMVYVSSVEATRLLPLEDGSAVGFIKIHHFQDSTLHEVKEAILSLSAAPEPVRGLILDLRGNPGGTFRTAVSVAELFVDGLIAIGQSSFKEYNRSFKSENDFPLDLPMVVLIDEETASAAEVVAGALQGGRPETKLLGRNTHGKGTIQCIIPMDKAPLDRQAGIRLTVARLYSPTNQPYTDRGVIPDVASEAKGEMLLLEARKLLLQLLNPSMPRIIALDASAFPT